VIWGFEKVGFAFRLDEVHSAFSLYFILLFGANVKLNTIEARLQWLEIEALRTVKRKLDISESMRILVVACYF
jgi:hypothetical protein